MKNFSLKQAVCVLLCVGLTSCGPTPENRPTEENLQHPENITDPGRYNITLAFEPKSDPRIISAISKARTRWEKIITGDLVSLKADIPALDCQKNTAWSGEIDDLLIFTGSRAIDGPGGILAESGPCAIRQGNGLPIYGVMIFDAADLNKSDALLTDIATHEMAHVLGFGTLWESRHLLTKEGDYQGPGAISRYHEEGGSKELIPVEDTGGEGSARVHWQEKHFGQELMTSLISSKNQLSKMSIGALADLGYQVSDLSADPVDMHGLSLTEAEELNIAHHERLIRP